MNIIFLLIGKSHFQFIKLGIEEYSKRLERYIRFQIIELPDVPNSGKLNEPIRKRKEAESMMKEFKPGDLVVLLDEKGKELSSVQFAGLMEKKMQSGIKRIVFVCGGAYGFDESLINLSSEKISLSRMTFSHQMARVIFLEQLYRAFTIIHREPYHHA